MPNYKDFPNKLVSPGAFVEGEEAIKEHVGRLFLTPKGSLIDNPDYGCGIPSYKYELMSEDTKVFIEMDVRDTIDKWEPRVIFKGLSVDVDPDNGTFTINVALFMHEYNKDITILVNPYADDIAA